MAAAMNLPVLPLLVLYWLDAIPWRGVLGGQMMLMLPAMLLAMLWRLDEYTRHMHTPSHRHMWRPTRRHRAVLP
jgi:hypothetical protein